MIADRIVELVRVPARELRQNPANWREHPRRQRQALRAILGEIGYAAPLIGRRSRGGIELIDGHLRAGLDPDQLLPVVVLDVSAAEARVLLATLDPIGAMAASNDEALAELLAGTAARSEPLAELLEALTPRLPAPGEDEVPALPRRPQTRPGDLVQLGEHVLVCADAADPATLSRLLDAPADAMITDPPYGVGYEGKTRRRLKIRNDRPAGLDGLLDASFAAAAHALTDGAPVYCFSPAGPGAEVFMHAFKRHFRMRQSLIWEKDAPVLGHSDYAYRHEPILYGYAGTRPRGRGRSGWYGGDAQHSIISVPKPHRSELHPTAKPVALLARLLENSTRRGQVVLDPFAGSGSLLLACEQLGRKAALVEIDPAYCDVIISRFQATTGEAPRRIA